MDQDGSEHNICSNREGLCPGKNSMELPAGRRFSSMVKNLCEVRTVYLNTATKYCNKKAAVSLILNENVSETLCIFSIDKTNCCRI